MKFHLMLKEQVYILASCNEPTMQVSVSVTSAPVQENTTPNRSKEIIVQSRQKALI